ncbi:FecR family protein [Bosea minatitlanensis]|uniref:FecR family protein n=1 Tax=Bosea minatitlanensis TaxID=128782 RepID=A0ABW0F242_9HYPH|nr:FecR family protein [Bosea minatitlanensis]MCT4495280.1 FecR family protein [Bosea minatitlanensis]
MSVIASGESFGRSAMARPPGRYPIRADDDSTPKREALQWLIARQEDADDPDVKARFRAWLARDPRNAEAWTEAQHLWGVLGEARAPAGRPVETAQPSRSRFPQGRTARSPVSARRRLRSGRLVVAAAGLVAGCLAVMFQPAIDVWLRADYSTGIAEIREIRLDDGSIAVLGAGSALDVAYEPKRRYVRLLSGEAYFEVKPDATRPFQVAAGEVDSTVLGTAFDVRLGSDAVSVAVNHGRVAVASPVAAAALAAPLGAGDWVRVASDGAVQRGKDLPELVGGWRSGMLAVRDRAIADVVEEIGRHYRGKILLAGGEIASKRVTGVYDLRRPADALQAIAQAHGARLHRVGPWLLVLSGW